MMRRMAVMTEELRICIIFERISRDNKVEERFQIINRN